MFLVYDSALALVLALASETPLMAPTRCRASSLFAFAHVGRPGREKLGMSDVGIASFPEKCLVEVWPGDPVCLGKCHSKISYHVNRCRCCVCICKDDNTHTHKQTRRLCTDRPTHTYIYIYVHIYSLIHIP